MNSWKRLTGILIPVFAFLFFLFSNTPAFADATTQPLLHQSDMTYLGSFRLPSGQHGMTNGSFEYASASTSGNVYDDPVNGKSLFMTGYLEAGYLSDVASIAQVKIPTTLADQNTTSPDNLPVATIVQGFADPSGGKQSQVLSGATGHGNSLVYGGKLIGTAASDYDASCSQSKSAWVSPINFAQNSQATGPYHFNSPVGARWVAGGYLALVPSEWQSLLGGKVVSGDSVWSIVSCGSPGPALHVIDADALVAQPPANTNINTIPLMYYEDGVHSSLGLWSSNVCGQVINGKTVPCITLTDPHGRGNFSFTYEDGTMRSQGMIFPDGTRSVLFFGSKGMGPQCYGAGGASGGDCYDPDNDYKGNHAYPYTEFVWAYDANDLLAVKNGTKNPWDVLPYTGWAFKVSGDGSGGQQTSVSWDAATRRAYVVVARTTSDRTPTVHVYSISATPDTTPPTSPTSLSATSPSQSSITVSWTAATDPTTEGQATSGVTNYQVERCLGLSCSNFTQVGTPTTSPFTDTGLTASTGYSYHVRAYDAAGNVSGWSNVVGATTQAPDTQAPTTPANLSAAASSSSTANLTWTASADNVGVTGYKVERCSGSSCTTFTQVGTSTTNSYTDSGLSASTTYRYQVRATDAAGNNSSYSSIASATTQTAPPVSYLQGAATTDTVTASFSSNNTAGNTIIAAISWGSNATPTCSDSQGNTYTIATNTYDSINNQSLGVCYATNIKAGANTFTVNVGGAGFTRILIHEYSGIASTNPVDITKTNIADATTVANNVTSTSATTTQNNDLIFGAVMDDAGSTTIAAGTNFTQRQSVNNKDLASQDSLQSTAGSIASTQTFGTTHRYLAHMVAFKTSGGSGGSSDTTPPTLPLNFNLAANATSSSSITVSWNPATDNVGVVRYDIERCQGLSCSNFTQVGTPTASPFIDSGLSASTGYSYHVRAVDAAGNMSGWSNVVGATTQAGSGGGTACNTVNVSTATQLSNAINTANGNASCSTTILVADGTYTLSAMLAIAAPNMTVKGASGDRTKVILQGDAMSSTANVKEIFYVNANNFTIENMTLQKVGWHTVQVVGENNRDNFVARNCVFRDAYEQIIKISQDTANPNVTADNGLVENSLFEYTAGIGPEYYIGGIDIHGGSNWTIRGNTFKNIISPDTAVAEHAVHIWDAPASNNLVEKNLIINCDRGIGFGLGDRGNSGGIIRNNMIYHAAGNGSFADVPIGLEESPNTQVYNNTIYLANSYPNAIEYRFTATTGVSIKNNLTNKTILARDGATGTTSNNITNAQSSWFTNVSQGDLHLANGTTSANNAGTTVSGLTDDYDGNTRPQGGGIDIGADEYVTPPTFSSCSTVTPTNFTDPTYTGYGAPYDVFASNTPLISTQCSSADTHTLTATLGIPGDTTRIVYTKGYYYDPGINDWTSFTGTCTGALNGEWCQGSVATSITDTDISTASVSDPSYLVGFTCRSQNGSWKCGCRDTSCSNFYWQVQGAGM